MDSCKQGLLRHQLDVPVTVLAGNFMPHVFWGSAKFLAAVRAWRVERLCLNGIAVGEEMIAVLALHLHPFVLPVNAELFLASGTKHVMAFRRRSRDHIDLRKRIERRNLNAVLCQFVIQ